MLHGLSTVPLLRSTYLSFESDITISRGDSVPLFRTERLICIFESFFPSHDRVLLCSQSQYFLVLIIGNMNDPFADGIIAPCEVQDTTQLASRQGPGNPVPIRRMALSNESVKIMGCGD